MDALQSDWCVASNIASQLRRSVGSWNELCTSKRFLCAEPRGTRVLRDSVLLLRICGTQDKLMSSVVHVPISCFTLGSISVREIRSVYRIVEATSQLAVCIQPDLFMLLVGEVLNNEFRTTFMFMSYCLHLISFLQHFWYILVTV